MLLKDENNGLYLLDTQKSLLDVSVDDKEITFHYISRYFLNKSSFNLSFKSIVPYCRYIFFIADDVFFLSLK